MYFVKEGLHLVLQNIASERLAINTLWQWLHSFIGFFSSVNRKEVQELFVLHLQIPDNPGQEIISGEIMHFVWAVAEDIQKLPSVQNR